MGVVPDLHPRLRRAGRERRRRLPAARELATDANAARGEVAAGAPAGPEMPGGGVEAELSGPAGTTSRA